MKLPNQYYSVRKGGDIHRLYYKGNYIGFGWTRNQALKLAHANEQKRQSIISTRLEPENN